MKKTDIMTITTAAIGTATLTVVAFWAGPIDAGNDADVPPAKIARAKMVSHGVELALSTVGDRTYKAGEQPEFELTAINKTGEGANFVICVGMTAASPASRMSRLMVMPECIWQQNQLVNLKANEKKVFRLKTGTTLPENKEIAVGLREERQKAQVASVPLPVQATAQLPQTKPVGVRAARPIFFPEITALTFSTVSPKTAPTVALNGIGSLPAIH